MCLTIIGHCRRIARHRRSRLVDRQSPVDQRQRVIGIRARHRIAIGPGILGRCPRGRYACQHRRALATHQTRHRKARHRLRAAIIGHCRGIARHRQCRLVDRQSAVHKCQIVIGIRAGRRVDIGPRIGPRDRRRHPRQHRCGLATHQTRGGKARHRLETAIIGHRRGIACDRRIRLVDRQSAIDQRQRVIGIRARHRIAIGPGILGRRPRGRYARQHRCAFAAHQTRHRKARHRLRAAVIGHRRGIARHNHAHFGDRTDGSTDGGARID